MNQKKKENPVEIGKYFELNNKNTFQDIWNADKFVLRGKFVERLKISKLSIHCKNYKKKQIKFPKKTEINKQKYS